MAKLEVIKKCFNCGAILQTSNKDAPGYITKRVLDENTHFLFCDKCYEEDTYNLLPPTLKLNPDFKVLLEDAKATDSLIVYFVDLFSFEVSFIPELNKLLNEQRVLVIATKRDLLPKKVDDETLKEYVKHRLRVEKVNPIDVLISSPSKKFLDITVSRIEELRERHDVYLLGSKNAGKTAMLHAYLRHFPNNTKRTIITSPYPHTKLKVMQVPLDKSSTMFDSEGLDVSNSLVSNVEPQILKSIIPTKEIINRRISVKKGDSLFIGGLARIDVASCKSAFFISNFFSSEVKIKKINSKQTDTLFEANLIKQSLKPVSKNFNSLTHFNIFQIEVEEVGERDIGIEGLGWFSFTGNNQTFHIYVPKGVAVYSSRAKVPYLK